MLEGSLDLLGQRLPIPIMLQHSMLESKKSYATKLVDVSQMTLQIQTEEIQLPLMEVFNHAKPLSKYRFI